MGRPKGSGEKLTPAISQKIIQGVKLGMPMKYAAQRAGVSERSIVRWKAEVRNGRNGIYKSFVAGIKKAESDFIAANLRVIDRAAKAKTWPAAAWLLERRCPEHFSANRAEMKQMRDQISELLKLIGEKQNGLTPTLTPKVETSETTNHPDASDPKPGSEPVQE